MYLPWPSQTHFLSCYPLWLIEDPFNEKALEQRNFKSPLEEAEEHQPSANRTECGCLQRFFFAYQKKAYVLISCCGTRPVASSKQHSGRIDHQDTLGL
jgi:hypothetical protein